MEKTREKIVTLINESSKKTLHGCMNMILCPQEKH